MLMKIKKLLEIITPKKPLSVKSSQFTKSGVQGTKELVKQRQFKTSKGNDVKVHFHPSKNSEGKRNVDVVFYVNNTTYDDSSTQDGKIQNDFEILSGVLYLTKSFVNRGKYDSISFLAQSGDGDQKRVKGMNTEPIKQRLEGVAKEFRKEVASYIPTKEEKDLAIKRSKDILRKFNKTIPPTVIYKTELLDALDLIPDFLKDDNLELGYKIRAKLQKYDKTVEKFDSYKNLQDILNRLLEAYDSHSGDGVLIHRNRRASLYNKLVNRYFSNEWSIKQDGDMFNLDKLNKIK